MTEASEELSPTTIALRMMDGESISTNTLRRQHSIGEGRAIALLDRAKEIRTAWMLMKFPRPRVPS
jgi:hypothetical protein